MPRFVIRRHKGVKSVYYTTHIIDSPFYLTAGRAKTLSTARRRLRRLARKKGFSISDADIEVY